ncbi:MAG: hypothetical protein IIB63_06080 [Proteobacteria bacterium]|nr:hypothetical protein [Pseudomonadota bacterium]
MEITTFTSKKHLEELVRELEGFGLSWKDYFEIQSERGESELYPFSISRKSDSVRLRSLKGLPGVVNELGDEPPDEPEERMQGGEALVPSGDRVAAVVLVVSTVGLVSTITFAVGESRQRAEAESQAETNKAISRFLDKMLSSVDPRKAKGRDMGVLRDILNEAASKVGSELSGKPRVEASVRRTIGLTLMNLSLYDEAAPHLERAVEIEESLQRKSHIELAEALLTKT